MAFAAGFKSRILVGDLNLSAYAQSVAPTHSTNMLPTTTFADNGVKRFIPGQTESAWSFDGLLDTDAAANLQFDNMHDWVTAEPLSYAPRGFAIGNEVVMGSALRTVVGSASNVADAVKFNLSAQTDGPMEYGVSLHDLGAETIDGQSASVNNGGATTNGAVAHLHITAYSGLTSISVIVEDSANDSTFATIATFTLATGITQERIAIAGTVRQYVRVRFDVTGTGSATFHVGLARR